MGEENVMDSETDDYIIGVEANLVGDMVNKGQPWRVPLVMGKGVDNIPEVRTLVLGVE